MPENELLEKQQGQESVGGGEEISMLTSFFLLLDLCMSPIGQTQPQTREQGSLEDTALMSVCQDTDQDREGCVVDTGV